MPAIRSAIYERFGLNAYVQGDLDKALSWFRKLEATEPDSIRVLRTIGVILLASGDTEGAERYLRREEALYGESFQRHAALADLAYAKGARDEAARRYAAALADRDAGKGAGSLSLLEKRLAICRDAASFQSAMAGARRFDEASRARDAGDHDKALALFLEAFSLDPTHWPALNNAGSIVLNRKDDPVEALRLFRQALALMDAPQVRRNAELAEAALGGQAGKKGGRTARRKGAGR